MKIVLATRRSKLALAQARAYVRSLIAKNPGLEIEELHVVTSGDRIQDRSLQEIGGKGLFIKEIEEALLDGRADFAVHSIKDVPAELAPGLFLGAIPRREDPRDVLVTRGGGLDALPNGARVGTSSMRRALQLKLARPDLVTEPLRGNVDTRLRKLEDGTIDAIVLAYAGLRRLDLGARANELFAPEAMLPAVGQGALGIECREDDARMQGVLATTDDVDTRIAVEGERAFMRAVGGSCQLPVAAYCVLGATDLHLRGLLADADGSNVRRGERRAPRPSDPLEARQVATALGEELGAALR
ncbi:MAG: hydroxymethylbilane synthase [Deltaproteobacteria bacterium]|nr:hydroxymethylbilane synthase [Deltaproteobacteria bacterium]